MCFDFAKYTKFPWMLSYMGLDERKLSWGVCEHQRCRPDCESAQSDQRLYYSLIGKYHI